MRAIVNALRAAGAHVEPTGRRNLPNYLVGWEDETHLLDILRTPTATQSKAKVRWVADWRGRKPFTVATAEEAFRVLGVPEKIAMAAMAGVGDMSTAAKRGKRGKASGKRKAAGRRAATPGAQKAPRKRQKK
jgi:hypothetical protein